MATSPQKFYITTPAYYPTSSPHIGTAYSTIATDVIARWWRLVIGEGNVVFVTGLDEHGSKMEKAAAQRGMPPQQFVDQMAEEYKRVWKALNISYDVFRRTSDKDHVEFVAKEMYSKLEKNGDVYKGTYEGWYCLPDESFWMDLQLVDGKCPECGRSVEKVKEDAYFFRLSKYQDKLLQLYNDNPDFISPAFRKQEIVNRVKEGLKDLCVSRSKVKWGIPIPGDPKFTIYVWIDALPFYISALNQPGDRLKRFWPPDIQIMAKEIFWFHTVIWPAMLMSVGYPLPKREFAHGWLTVNGQKIGKSLGNAIDPVYLANRYTTDALRYHLFREISFGNDGDFSEETLKTRVNNELVANYSNLFYRVTSFIAKNFEGKVPEKGQLGEMENALFAKATAAVSQYEKHMSNTELTQALGVVVDLTTEVNRYIQTTEPWKTIKIDPQKAGTSLYVSANMLRTLTLLYHPFMPGKCKEALDALGVKLEWWNVDKPMIPSKHAVAPVMLFKKFEGAVEAIPPKQKPPQTQPQSQPQLKPAEKPKQETKPPPDKNEKAMTKVIREIKEVTEEIAKEAEPAPAPERKTVKTITKTITKLKPRSTKNEKAMSKVIDEIREEAKEIAEELEEDPKKKMTEIFKKVFAPSELRKAKKAHEAKKPSSKPAKKSGGR